MHATIRPNTTAFPHNSPSWDVEVFDDNRQSVYVNTVMVPARSPFSLHEQVIAMLGKYTAKPSDVTRVDGGFHVSNVHPL